MSKNSKQTGGTAKNTFNLADYKAKLAEERTKKLNIDQVNLERSLITELKNLVDIVPLDSVKFSLEGLAKNIEIISSYTKFFELNKFTKVKADRYKTNYDENTHSVSIQIKTVCSDAPYFYKCLVKSAVVETSETLDAKTLYSKQLKVIENLDNKQIVDLVYSYLSALLDVHEQAVEFLFSEYKAA